MANAADVEGSTGTAAVADALEGDESKRASEVPPMERAREVRAGFFSILVGWSCPLSPANDAVAAATTARSDPAAGTPTTSCTVCATRAWKADLSPRAEPKKRSRAPPLGDGRAGAWPTPRVLAEPSGSDAAGE
jgi:hypothetical protein